ncbi:hypothetical protein Y032_0007g3223 [Ancylostoma ceylanicum]|uniref:Uncharacterized protein n=1 Tax=Ancylostoma ceylanicum TaxID=53326 RepID=A0A016VLY6_9BILA|nr:hypothetical protein Y032_0007g3223 [Ancylostoma ceylanicum]
MVLCSGSLPATPRSGENGGQSSPRRPLYVDTQLANGVGEKRRSPVTSVVDFVRGRNRASSLSGPATPPSPPTTMSVSARASASTDGGVPTSPVFSPQPRGNGRPPLSRLYRPGIRSLDSGLDLSSPTIGHTALLIKEDCLEDAQASSEHHKDKVFLNTEVNVLSGY